MTCTENQNKIMVISNIYLISTLISKDKKHKNNIDLFLQMFTACLTIIFKNSIYLNCFAFLCFGHRYPESVST